MNAAISLAHIMQTDPNLLVPIVSLTEQAEVALEAVSQAINSVPEGVFRDFVNNVVVYNVEVLGGVSDGILVGDHIHTIGTGSSLVDVSTDSLVYIRHSISTLAGGMYYVGSTANGYSRIVQHKASISGSRHKESIHEKLESIGSGIGFSQVYRSANYYNLAISQLRGYKLSAGEL